MSKSILNEIDELLEQQVITPETAQSIRTFYQQKTQQSGNRLVIVFGILGSLLVSLGLVLIIAHNWDTIAKMFKLMIALSPLLIGQLICGWLLWKNSESKAWREGVSVFLIFAVAISISIVSQVYHISGNLANFLMIWMILSIPIVYVMRSSMASLLCWIGVSWFGTETNYNWQDVQGSYVFWYLLATLAPWYVYLVRKNPHSNYTYFHHWVICISIVTLLGTFADQSGELLLPVYMTLFGIFLLVGQLPFFTKQKLLTNAYLIGGSLGTIGLLLSMSFDWFWDAIATEENPEWWRSVEAIVFIVLFAVAFYLLEFHRKAGRLKKLYLKSYIFFFFAILYLFGLVLPNVSQVLVNVIILALAVSTVFDGVRSDRLWQMNYGLLILTALIICRFFDTDLSFVVRGLLFVIVGLGFFGVNYWMVQKRKSEQYTNA